jgi:hypothetical protein
MESPMPLMPTTPFKLRTSGTCTTRNSYDAPSTTKRMALQMTSMSSRQLTPCQQDRERSITFQRFTTSPDDQIPQGLQVGY